MIQSAREISENLSIKTEGLPVLNRYVALLVTRYKIRIGLAVELILYRGGDPL